MNAPITDGEAVVALSLIAAGATALNADGGRVSTVMQAVQRAAQAPAALSFDDIEAVAGTDDAFLQTMLGKFPAFVTWRAKRNQAAAPKAAL